MFRAALRDLQFRRRRFVIALVGASLVFAISLVMTGLAASFDNEADRTLDVIGATTWFVREDVPGPFVSFAPIGPAALAAAEAAGAEDAAPIARTLQSIGSPDDSTSLSLFGVEVGATGSPTDVDKGRPLEAPGEAVVSTLLGYDPGDEVDIGGRTFAVVGEVDASLLAGSPVVFIPLEDFQAVVLDGQDVFTAVVSSNEVTQDPPGLRSVGAADARADALAALEDAAQTIAAVRTLLWIVAALVIGSVMYLNALERVRDVAVFKAIGLSTWFVAGGMALQAVILGLASSLAAIAIGLVLAPLFPMRVEIPVTGMLLLPVVAVVIALLGSLAGIRRAATVSPALAFAGA
jgi:putative ABC transport system permease protein